MVQFPSYLGIQDTAVVIIRQIDLLLYEPNHLSIGHHQVLLLELEYPTLDRLPLHSMLLGGRPLKYFKVLLQLIFRLGDMGLSPPDINKLLNLIQQIRLPIFLGGLQVINLG